MLLSALWSLFQEFLQFLSKPAAKFPFLLSKHDKCLLFKASWYLGVYLRAIVHTLPSFLQSIIVEMYKEAPGRLEPYGQGFF